MVRPGSHRAILPGNASHTQIRRHVLMLAWPVITEQVLATITQMIDMAMVGRLGASAIAAVGISIQPMMLAFSLFAAFAVGTTAVVARSIGQNNPRDASAALNQSLLFGMGLTLVLGIFAFRYTHLVVGIMGPEPDVLALGIGYVRWVLPGMAFMLAAFIISAALRGAGDTITPMKVNLVINILNPILNYMLIFGNLGMPAMGVNGAALGTTIARGLGGVILLYIVFARSSTLRLNVRDMFRVDRSMLIRVIRVGLPASAEQFISRMGQILFMRVVAGLGTIAYASHTIAVNAESISFMPALGFAAAGTTLVGQNLGAGQPEVAARTGWETWWITMRLMMITTATLFLFPWLMVRIYTTDPDVIHLGQQLIRIIAFAQIPMATFFVMGGNLRGAGDTRTMLYISIGSVWLIRLTLSHFLVTYLGLGIHAVWYVMILDWVIRGGLATYRFHSGKWKGIRV